jgi:hypothetical protein
MPRPGPGLRAPMTMPTRTPPPAVVSRRYQGNQAPDWPPSIQVNVKPKKTAATPSLKRDSLSTSRRARPVILRSLRRAITATGSVAALSLGERTFICARCSRRAFYTLSKQPRGMQL